MEDRNELSGCREALLPGYSGFCYYQSVLLFLLCTVFYYGNVMDQTLMTWTPGNLRYKFVICFES